MKEPKRLLSSDDDFTRAMRDAWRAEQPSKEALAKALAIGSAPPTPLPVAKGGASLGAKGVTGVTAAFVGVGVACTLVVVWPRHEPPSVPVPSEPRVVAAPRADLADDAGRGPTAAPVASVAPAPRRPTPPHSVGGARSDLGEQVAAIDRARRELEGGRSANALDELDAYKRRFPHGALDDEATVLRVQALLAQGRSDAARRAAAHLLAAHPDSPQAERVRSMLQRSP